MAQGEGRPALDSDEWARGTWLARVLAEPIGPGSPESIGTPSQLWRLLFAGVSRGDAPAAVDFDESPQSDANDTVASGSTH